MEIRIDVIYQDGEVVGCCKQGNKHRRSLPILYRGAVNTLELRFCNPDGEPETVITPEVSAHVQALLSCRDRLLVSREEDITLSTDENGFQILRIGNLDVDNQAVRNLLADSYLDLERKNHGCIACEFSVAFYSDSVNHLMQLFFTLDVLVKNIVLQ